MRDESGLLRKFGGARATTLTSHPLQRNRKGKMEDDDREKDEGRWLEREEPGRVDGFAIALSLGPHAVARCNVAEESHYSRAE